MAIELKEYIGAEPKEIDNPKKKKKKKTKDDK